jgi:hypothetical protein
MTPPQIKIQARVKVKTRKRPRKTSPGEGSNSYINFIIPLCGILTAIAAHLFDMGARSRRAKGTQDTERTPLLDTEGSSGSRIKEIVQWLARNAVSYLGDSKSLSNC